MATRARFGRLARSAPSLTATIVALAQEYQRVRDNNIEDAWKNGGMFEGKHVTDQQMLKYWTGRRDSVSHDDPMWDYYNNMLHGFQFNIDETTEYLKYKQKKISEGQMAAFYEKWARKLPVNSANYRALMTKAAEFRDSAARGRSSSNYQAREERYQRDQQATIDKYEAPWDVFEQAVMGDMIKNNYVEEGDLTSNNNGGWAAFNDPSILHNLLWRLNNDPALEKSKNKLIAAMNDPGFNGVFNEAQLKRLLNRKKDGLAQRKTRAIKTNHKDDANKVNAEDQRATAADFTLQTADYQAIVAEKGRALSDVMADPTATPTEVADAIRATRSWFDTEGRRMLENENPGGFDPLSGKPVNQVALDVMSQLEGTISALDGKQRGLTAWDDPYGVSSAEGGENSYAFRVSATAADVLPQADALADGSGILVRIGEDHKITSGQGAGWSVKSINDPEIAGEGIYVMPNPDGQRQAYKGAPITIKAYKGIDPDTRMPVGDPIQMNRDGVVGNVVTYDAGNGEQVTVYGVYVDGELRWTHVNPIPATASSQVHDEADGSVTITGIVPPNAGGKVDTNQWIDRASLGATKTGPDGATWVVGSQTSILQTRMRANDWDAMKVANRDDASYAADEADYFTRHPTKAMQGAQAQGGDAGFQAALNDEVRKSVNTKQSIRFYGPESQRDKVISMMQSKADAETADRLGRQAKDDAALRQRMVDDVTAWQRDQRPPVPAGQSSQSWNDKLDAAQRKTNGLPSLSGIPGGSNWSLRELLTSPQISTQHAQSIAAYLTRGDLGQGTLEHPEYVDPTAVMNSPYVFDGITRSLGPRATAQKTGTSPMKQGAPRWVPDAAPVPAAVPVNIAPTKPKPDDKPDDDPNQRGFEPRKTKSISLTHEEKVFNIGGR